MTIALHAETEKSIKAYAKKRNIQAPEAADKLVSTAIGRLGALAKYAQAQKAPKGKAKKGAKTKATGKKNGKK